MNKVTISGKRIAAEAAGVLVALLGRNEGGKTLSQATVDFVMDDLKKNLTGSMSEQCTASQRSSFCARHALITSSHPAKLCAGSHVGFS